MDAKKIALLVGALFVAAVTAIMAKSMFGAAPAPMVVAAAPQPTGPQVLVATKALPMGTILGPDSIRFQTWPKDLVDGAYYVRGAAGVDPIKMQGMVVRADITAGQPVTQGTLVSPQDRGFLAAALTPGMRAVTVSVGGASAVAGFVFPGDRVDLMLTSNVDTSSTAPQSVATGPNGQPAPTAPHDNRPLQTTETVMRNVRVLATDQRVDNTPTPEGKTTVSNFSLVTLEATPKMAEKIAVAQKIGQLSLSLRPLADTNAALEKAVATGDLPVPAGTDPKAADKKVLLAVASQPQDSLNSFTTGGEVSRFARGGMQLSGRHGHDGAMPGAPVQPIIHIARGAAVTDTPVGGK